MWCKSTASQTKDGPPLCLTDFALDFPGTNGLAFRLVLTDEHAVDGLLPAEFHLPPPTP